jgi:hypothetical protein
VALDDLDPRAIDGDGRFEAGGGVLGGADPTIEVRAWVARVTTVAGVSGAARAVA